MAALFPRNHLKYLVLHKFFRKRHSQTFPRAEQGKNQENEQKRTFPSAEDGKINIVLPLVAEKGNAELTKTHDQMKKIHTGLSEAKLDEQSLRMKKLNH